MFPRPHYQSLLSLSPWLPAHSARLLSPHCHHWYIFQCRSGLLSPQENASSMSTGFTPRESAPQISAACVVSFLGVPQASEKVTATASGGSSASSLTPGRTLRHAALTPTGPKTRPGAQALSRGLASFPDMLSPGRPKDSPSPCGASSTTGGPTQNHVTPRASPVCCCAKSQTQRPAKPQTSL